MFLWLLFAFGCGVMIIILLRKMSDLQYFRVKDPTGLTPGCLLMQICTKPSLLKPKTQVLFSQLEMNSGIEGVKHLH